MIDTLLAHDIVPDALVRAGIRRLLAQRIREETRATPEAQHSALLAYIEDLKARPIAENTADANEQHYEVPARFFELSLGPRLKYSGCLFPTGGETLAQAEEHMLALYVERAQLSGAERILELGCGWGSLSLYMAERFPLAAVTAVSNSTSQKQFIDEQARLRGLSNLQVITCDMNVFEAPRGRFDRVVSIEMFEHMKNYQKLLARIATWLEPGGLLFVHIFTHARFAYHFEARDASDWMARHFFTGGQMPSHELLAHFQQDLRLDADWKINGRHYQQTAEHWLGNMDRHKAEILPLLAQTYGAHETTRWWSYWRIFFMSCAELWGYRKGEEWLVSHYRFRKPQKSPARG